jgi:hypothetical protein
MYYVMTLFFYFSNQWDPFKPLFSFSRYPRLTFCPLLFAPIEILALFDKDKNEIERCKTPFLLFFF